jgi:hypothetical protein
MTMNYRKEKYPKEIQEAIKKSQSVLKKLDFKIAPRLKDIYSNKLLSDKIHKGAGLYIFIENNKPVYVGISRFVKKRLRQHGWGKRHNEATLAFLITEHEMEYITKKSKLDYKHVEMTQARLQNRKVITVPIEEDDPFLLYFMEVYISGCLKTKWNTFRTH